MQGRTQSAFSRQNSYTTSVWSPLSIRASSTMIFSPLAEVNSVFMARSTSAMDSACPWAMFWLVM